LPRHGLVDKKGGKRILWACRAELSPNKKIKPFALTRAAYFDVERLLSLKFLITEGRVLAGSGVGYQLVW